MATVENVGDVTLDVEWELYYISSGDPIIDGVNVISGVIHSMQPDLAHTLQFGDTRPGKYQYRAKLLDGTYIQSKIITLIPDPDCAGKWHLFYASVQTSYRAAIGQAISDDGITWERVPDFTLTAGSEEQDVVKWCDRILPDDLIYHRGKYYLSFHGFVGKNNIEPESYGYVINDRNDMWVGGILVSDSLNSGWTDLFGDYYKPFGMVTSSMDIHAINGGEGIFFLKNRGSEDICMIYYITEFNQVDNDAGHVKDGIAIAMLPKPNGTHESVTNDIDLSRTSKVVLP